ncbi:biosynthetic arginine decarboxylase [Agarivorans litoreus]|uniref:biosynthetic arginine decarboxylase n=1 Tax=Agarivorans litoreus TaxID=1510455 RepID=UPI001C7D8F08|nr:biosynthetic arginine decarboxylase [Agarivorans litoreus]
MKTTDWTTKNSCSLYNIPFWSQGYFDINTSGNVVVRPNQQQPNDELELTAISRELTRQGVSLPALVRFPQILGDRVARLCQAFNQAMSNYQYQGDYLAVYPIKVNQQRNVVKALLESRSAKQRQLGLEAGSKPELMAVLAVAQQASSVIVCNGYKDREYIRLALIGEKLGHQVYIVLEKLSELEMVISEAAKLGVTPRLGLRARLASQGHGKWQASGGEKSKFGLSAAQVLKVVSELEHQGMLSSLKLLHFHLGSQIANIRDVRKGVSEAARFYCELRQLGAEISCIDVGGGLAVDYDGTRSQNPNSMNYSMAEYANNIVYSIGDICQQYNHPMPRIISESGRSLSAHHAVLITDVIGIEGYHPEAITAPDENAPQILHNMWATWTELNQGAEQRAIVESYHDSQSDLAEVHTQFNLALLDLEQRAWAEQLNLRISYEIQQRLSRENRSHLDLLNELRERLADKFFVNFSLFQSLPDNWGIDQVFPILPLSGLDKAPDRRAVMLDITCDSDGSIDQYVDGLGIETTLPVPAWNKEEPYLMGFFLVGAYQEILGDIHNLFGDTDTASVLVDAKGKMRIKDITPGDTVEDVLGYVNLNSDEFIRSYRELVRQHIPKDQQRTILSELEAGLRGYTYLEDYVEA